MSNADIVNEWFRTRVSSGPIAQNTPAYNQLVAALPFLIADLDASGAAAAAKPSKAAKAAAAAAPEPSTPAADDPK